MVFDTFNGMCNDGGPVQKEIISAAAGAKGLDKGLLRAKVQVVIQTQVASSAGCRVGTKFSETRQ